MIYGIERVVGVVVAKLKADLPDKVTALNAEYADDWTLEAPAEENYYAELTDPTLPAFGFPAIVVLASQDKMLGKSAVGGEVVVEHQIIVDVVVRESDRAALGHKLWRYTRGLKEILTVDLALAGMPTVWMGTNWRQPRLVTKRSPGTMVQDAPSLFSVTVIEYI